MKLFLRNDIKALGETAIQYSESEVTDTDGNATRSYGTAVQVFCTLTKLDSHSMLEKYGETTGEGIELTTLTSMAERDRVTWDSKNFTVKQVNQARLDGSLAAYTILAVREL